MDYDWTESETRGQASNDTCSLKHCKARERVVHRESDHENTASTNHNKSKP